MLTVSGAQRRDVESQVPHTGDVGVAWGRYKSLSLLQSPYLGRQERMSSKPNERATVLPKCKLETL